MKSDCTRVIAMLTAAKLGFSVAKLKCCQSELACAASPEKLAFQAVKPQFPFPNGMMKPNRCDAVNVTKEKKRKKNSN